MKPTELTSSIVSAFSFLGELASVMRQNNVPLKREGRVSSSKAGVTQGATSWDCPLNEQARLMLRHKGKEVSTTTVTAMEAEITSHNLRAKAGYALEAAFGLKMDALHKAFKDGEKEGAKTTPAKTAKDSAESAPVAKAA